MKKGLLSLAIVLICNQFYGQINRHINLDGVDDNLKCIVNSIIPNSSDFTVEFKFKICSINSVQILMDALGSSAGSGIDFRLNNTILQIKMINSSGYANSYDANVIFPQVVGEWNTFSYTYSVSDSLNSIYLNGNLIHSYNYRYEGYAFLTLGGDDSMINFTSSEFDEVRISDIIRYNGPYSPQSVPFVVDPNTITLLHLDDSPTATVAVDETSNGNNFNINGGASTSYLQITGDDFVCASTSTVLTGNGGGPYLWTNSNSIDSVTGTIINYYPTAASTVYLAIMHANGCIDRDSLYINYNLPNVDAGVDQPVCFGDAVTLLGSGATSYVWNNGVSDGVVFVPNVSATYSVTGTDASGCINTSSVDVVVNSLPSVSTNLNSVSVCLGDTITLYGLGASAYTWDNGIFDNVEFVPVATTTYTVVGIDALGCMNTSTAVVTVDPLPTPTISNNSLNIVSDITGASYQWYFNGVAIATETNQSIDATTNGSYYIEVTNANGCVGVSNTITISIVGLEDLTSQNTIRVYPNPTSGIVYIRSESKIGSDIAIYNLMGELIVSFPSSAEELDLTKLTAGVYVLKVDNSIVRIVLN